MFLTRKTFLLMGVAGVLGALNLLPSGEKISDKLPSLPSVPPDDVTRVEISTPIDKITFQRVSTEKGTADFDRWRIVSPVEVEADAAQLRSMLRIFGPGVTMDALVDEGNLEDYGVDDQNGKRVELFTQGDVPTISVMVGKTAAGQTSFVRLYGEDQVYRADVGGRARYDRTVEEWRNRVALDLDRTKVSQFRLTRGGETLTFVRGPSTAVDDKGAALPGDWSLVGVPFRIDQEATDLVLRAVTHVRAGAFHNPSYDAGFEQPIATATVEIEGTTHTLTLGGRSTAEVAFVRVDDQPEIIRTAGQVTRLLQLPVDGLRDRTLVSLALGDIARMTLVDGGLTVVLEQTPDSGLWRITQPPNMDADQRQAQLAAAALGPLRADAIPIEAVFAPSGSRLTVLLRDGQEHTLEFGQAERDAQNRPLVFVRVVGKEGLYMILESTLSNIRKAFGRG